MWFLAIFEYISTNLSVLYLIGAQPSRHQIALIFSKAQNKPHLMPNILEACKTMDRCLFISKGGRRNSVNLSTHRLICISSSSSLGVCKAGCITSSQASPDETDDGSTKNYGCNTRGTSYNSAINSHTTHESLLSAPTHRTSTEGEQSAWAVHQTWLD